MKTTSAALLVAFLLLLTACGSTSGPNVVTTGSAGAAGEAGDQGGSPAGSDPSGSTATMEAALRAVGNPVEINSARFETTTTLTGAEGSETPGEFSIKMAGVYDQAAEASRLTMDMSGLAEMASSGDGDLGFMDAFLGDDIEIITLGDRAWVRMSLLTMFIGAGDKWLESSAGDFNELTSDFSAGNAPLPTELFDLLADAKVEVEEIGTEQIRGVDTVHSRLVVDLESLAGSMSDTEREELEATIGAAPTGTMPIDLWLDEDGRLHRYVIEATDLAADSADGVVAGLRIVFEQWDHGADVDVAPPQADEILTEDELDFGFGVAGDFFDLDG